MAASVRHAKNTALLPAEAAMQMISSNFKLEPVLYLRAFNTAVIQCPTICFKATIVIT